MINISWNQFTDLWISEKVDFTRFYQEIVRLEFCDFSTLLLIFVNLLKLELISRNNRWQRNLWFSHCVHNFLNQIFNLFFFFFFSDLIVKESDNNVKLIVLDRLIAMKDSPSHERILQELVMDILRVLSSPDLEVRRKTLTLALDLVTSRNIDELVLVLKKVKYVSELFEIYKITFIVFLANTIH